MKKITFLILFILAANKSYSQIRYDTLFTLPVGSGIIYTKVLAPSIPWEINILRIDLNNPLTKIMTAKANDRLAGFERTSSMAARNSFAGHRVVGAINGDFYGGTGIPINIQIRGGQVLRAPASLSTLGFDINNNPMLNIVSLSGRVFNKQNQSISISSVNATRGTDQLILYNRFFGNSTSTNQFGTEVLIQRIGEWFVNDTMRFVVSNRVANTGNMLIPDTTFAVLSGHGSTQTFLTTLNVGDTIKLITTISPGLFRLKELIGGYPRIVRNGINSAVQGFNDEGGPSHTFERHPRTAAGFSADSSQLFLLTVDGRQTISAGMTLVELADFMVQIGVHWGINFDGGGSTTMVVRDSIVNSPSDGGGERSVSNSLLVISKAPQDTLSKLIITPQFMKIYRGSSIQFRTFGSDNYFNPIPLNQSTLTYSLSKNFGTITPTGLFTAGLNADSGYVIVSRGSLKDSAKIIVQSISRISVIPKTFVTDTIRTQEFRMSAFDPDGAPRPLNLTDYTWQVTNPTIASIDAQGRLQGLRSGSTQVIVSYQGVRDTAFATVQVGRGTILLSSLDSLVGWSLQGENIDSIGTNLNLCFSQFSQGRASFKVDYKFTYDPNKVQWVHIKRDIPIFGVPDSIIIDAKSDGMQHHISFIVSDENGELYRINTRKFATDTIFFESLNSIVANAGAMGGGGFFNFPLLLRQISIKLGSTRQANQAYQGTIYLDNLRIAYQSGLTNLTSEDKIINEKNFMLYQNFPNPFNASTVIKWFLPKQNHVTLKIFDVLGNEIATLVDEIKNPGNHEIEFDAGNLPSGIYFNKISIGEITKVNKMILLK